MSLRIFFTCLIPMIFAGCHSISNKSFSQTDIIFKNQSDGVTLSGTLTMPIGKGAVPAVVLIHGSGPHNRDLEFLPDHKLFKDLAEYLSAKGIAVLRYDKRGVGKSGGQFIPYDLENYKNDGIAAVEYLKTIKEVDNLKIGVLGISEGGLVAPLMCSSCADINFAVLLGSPGIWGKEFFYSSQLAMTKAAGFKEDKISEMKIVFDKLWPLLTKEKVQTAEEAEGKELLKELWHYIDTESRNDFGFLDNNIDFWFNLYRGSMIRKYYSYDPKEALKQIKCAVLVMTGDKDVQATPQPNLSAIKEALENGRSKNFKIVELKNHNHILQVCRTGKVSEYKNIKGTMSAESLSIIETWIKSVTKTQ